MSTDVQRSQAGRRRHLMIVDDERDTTKGMSILLRLDGYNVQAFHNGKDAIHALMSSTPDAVLLDIGMPEMDAYAVARWIRQQPGLESLCVIAVSGYCQPQDLERSKSAGCDHHFIKPVDHRALLALLATL
jgi:CheY-like chemotaxis protein